MSAPERLVGLFLTAPAVGKPPALVAVPDARPGLRLCVLGGGRSGASFARALAGRLARAPGARCAVLCHVFEGAAGETMGRSPGPPSAPAPGARRLARALAGDGLAAEVRGRTVEVAVRASEPELERVLATVSGHAAGAPVVSVVPGARTAALDRALGRHDAILAVVAPGAPASLSALAVAELQARAPGAVVEAVALPARGGGVARRSAVGRVLAGLR